MNMNFKSQKGVTLWRIVIIICVIIIGIQVIRTLIDFTAPNNGIGSAAKEEAEYKVAQFEADLANLRYAIAQSELKQLENPRYGYSTISQTLFDRIGQYVKELDRQNDWFGNLNSSFTGIMVDTSSQEVTQLSDGNYIATFVTKKNGSTTILVSYTFKAGNIGNGAKILINNI